MLIYPLALVVALIAINVWGGSIAFPIVSDNAQRDFNTALGTSLLSGYFLLTIRFIHKNLAVNLYSILVIKGIQTLYHQYRYRIAHSFKKHVVWSISVGFVMPIVYMIAEGVVTRINEPEVMVVAITAIPFWFLLTLFFIQTYSSNRILRTLNDTEELTTTCKINLSRKVLNVGLTSATMALSGTALIPIFWINQPIHSFDLFFVILIISFISLFLMWPLFKMAIELKRLTNVLLEENERKISQFIKTYGAQSKGSQIEQLLTEQENYTNYLTTNHRLKLFLCVMPLPVSWFCFLLIETVFLS